MANIELTAVVLTLNEELRLPNCLSNLSSLRRCVVVDSGSTDRTVDVAIEIGCDVYINPWQGFAKQRNWALENTGIDTDWVLFVDADEVYPLHFFEWFAKEVSGHSEIDAVMVPSYLFFRGRRLKFAPGYPIYHPRLVRASKVRFSTNHAGHGESIEANCRHIYAGIPYEHYFYGGDLSAWLHKHVDHAFAEADAKPSVGTIETRRGKMSSWVGRSFLRVPLRFLYHFVLRQGFRDGRAGLQYALMYTWFEATKYVIKACRR